MNGKFQLADKRWENMHTRSRSVEQSIIWNDKLMEFPLIGSVMPSGGYRQGIHLGFRSYSRQFTKVSDSRLDEIICHAERAATCYCMF